MTAHTPDIDRLTFRLPVIASSLGFYLTFWPVATTDGAPLPWLLAVSVGLLAGALYWHPYRAWGILPPALAVQFLAVLAAVAWGWHPVTAAAAGLTQGLVLGGVFATRRAEMWKALRHPPPPDPSAWSVTRLLLDFLPTVTGLVIVLTPFLVFGLGASPHGDPLRFGYTVAAAVVLGLGAILAWLRLFRPTFELCAEPVLWVMYRVRRTGPGLAAFPARGPCLVVANHACWLDPVFLAKVLPRPTTPMMTSKFYDVPVLRRLMRAFGVIRVPEATYKQDPAEIREAVAALDRGACVVIFPEGFMRRGEEKPLRRFGRGVWHILRERPNTPVFACWIEGGWGSYCSYYNGKPTKNKKPDFRRPIRVGVSAAVVVDPATLESHLPTRLFLMNQVAEARKHLGLPELPAYELPQKSDDEKEEG
jgi:1-acyl-sn-glycerol-3-phosphate acyltransferase